MMERNDTYLALKYELFTAYFAKKILCIYFLGYSPSGAQGMENIAFESVEYSVF
jgi:hypothetical protein